MVPPGRGIGRRLDEAEREALASEPDGPPVATVEAELAGLVQITTEPPALTEAIASVMTTTARKARSAAFRVAVRRAYGFRCAVCGLGLRSLRGEPEVEAAHIYPRSRNGSDDPRNGIALCQHHHWCFDRGCSPSRTTSPSSFVATFRTHPTMTAFGPWRASPSPGRRILSSPHTRSSSERGRR